MTVRKLGPTYLRIQNRVSWARCYIFKGNFISATQDSIPSAGTSFSDKNIEQSEIWKLIKKEKTTRSKIKTYKKDLLKHTKWSFW